MAARRRRALSGALALLLALACAQKGGSASPFERLIEVTPAQERQMGAQLDRIVRENLTLIDDPLVLAAVNDIGQSLVRQVEPQPFVYRFRVVVDPTLNAFAGPAGYIFFHTGLLLAAGSLDELAGVMAHEIAHAKRSHVARSIEKATVPDLLAKILGVGVAVAADEPGALIAAEGVSQSLQLAYSREFEAEADEVGVAFLVRAGYDPMGMATFFERLAAEKRPELGFEVPPYLESHPRVEARLGAAVERARTTTVPGHVDPQLRASFAALQVRLVQVLDSGRTTLPAGHPAPDLAKSGAALAGAERLAQEGDLEAAVFTLSAGEQAEPNDPRLPFRRGEWLRELGRREDAIAAWRRALLLDPEVALTYFQIGRAYKELGDRVSAVFYLEQAERRFEPGKSGAQRAERMIRFLTLPVLAAAGFADGSRSAGADTPAGRSREEFPPGAEVRWWGRVEPEWIERRREIELVWTDPGGREQQRDRVETIRGAHVMSELEQDADAPGVWTAEARLEDETLGRWTFRVVPPEPEG
jgi:predicted Zn-dependent protease